MIYTSYFAMIHKIARGAKYVSIARYQPKWIKIPMPVYNPLMPSYDNFKLFKENKDEVAFIERYMRENLARLNCDEVYRQLDGSILLCHENPKNFCHRHLVANWFREHGYECNELRLT